MPPAGGCASWPAALGTCKTVRRRFRQSCRNEVLRDVLTDLANILREQGRLDEEECSIDAMFSSAKGDGQEIGPTSRGKSVEIMGIVDGHGLSLFIHREMQLDNNRAGNLIGTSSQK